MVSWNVQLVDCMTHYYLYGFFISKLIIDALRVVYQSNMHIVSRDSCHLCVGIDWPFGLITFNVMQ